MMLEENSAIYPSVFTVCVFFFKLSSICLFHSRIWTCSRRKKSTGEVQQQLKYQCTRTLKLKHINEIQPSLKLLFTPVLSFFLCQDVLCLKKRLVGALYLTAVPGTPGSKIKWYKKNTEKNVKRLITCLWIHQQEIALKTVSICNCITTHGVVDALWCLWLSVWKWMQTDSCLEV